MSGDAPESGATAGRGGAWWAERRGARVRARTTWPTLFGPAARPRLAGLPARRTPRLELPPPARLLPDAVADADKPGVLALAGAWEPAASLVVGQAVEGPGGSVDLSWRVLHEGPWPAQRAAARRPPLPDDEPRAVSAGLRVPLWKRLAYLLKPPVDLLLAASGPIEWPAALFPYQVDGIKALLARDALLLADDMGLGKTVEAIAALRILALQHQAEASLVVVPAGLIGQWRRTLSAWAPELRVSTVRGPAAERAWQWLAPAHVYLASYETLREDYTSNPQAPARRRTWDVVVLDEAQRIKNRDADVSRKCKLLPRRRAWALTGTPLENSLDDLASVLEFVAPYRPGESLVRWFPGAALLEQQQRVQLRRRKVDVLPQLPPKVLSRVPLQLEGSQRASYERAEREGVYALRARGSDVRIENVLELITRLKQICNVCPASGQSAKLADLSQRLATLVAEGHRALVFSQFTDATFGAHALAARLEAFRPLVYTGALTLSAREDVIHTFKEDPARRVLILSLRAGGQGLNLQEAPYVFHFDRWWNPAVERQAEDRSHRLGQRHPVHVYAYTCEGTIEERVDALLRKKQRLFEDVVDEVTLDLRSVLSSAELFGLFGLAPPPLAAPD